MHLRCAKKKQKKDTETINKEYAYFKQTLLDKDEAHRNQIKGFQKYCAPEIMKILGKDGANMHKDSKGCWLKLNKYRENVKTANNNRFKHSGRLKDYSSWLAAFNSSDFEHPLEVPGQYDGLQKPIPEDHATIDGFDDRVLVSLIHMRHSVPGPTNQALFSKHVPHHTRI